MLQGMVSDSTRMSAFFHLCVSNVCLWETLLDLLDAHYGNGKFIKVPSHMNILGNNEANRLADQGQLSRPQCPV